MKIAKLLFLLMFSINSLTFTSTRDIFGKSWAKIYIMYAENLIHLQLKLDKIKKQNAKLLTEEKKIFGKAREHVQKWLTEEKKNLNCTEWELTEIWAVQSKVVSQRWTAYLRRDIDNNKRMLCEYKREYEREKFKYESVRKKVRNNQEILGLVVSHGLHQLAFDAYMRNTDYDDLVSFVESGLITHGIYADQRIKDLDKSKDLLKKIVPGITRCDKKLGVGENVYDVYVETRPDSYVFAPHNALVAYSQDQLIGGKLASTILLICGSNCKYLIYGDLCPKAFVGDIIPYGFIIGETLNTPWSRIWCVEYNGIKRVPPEVVEILPEWRNSTANMTGKI